MHSADPRYSGGPIGSPNFLVCGRSCGAFRQESTTVNQIKKGGGVLLAGSASAEIDPGYDTSTDLPNRQVFESFDETHAGWGTGLGISIEEAYLYSD
jgi:hypothetical protein